MLASTPILRRAAAATALAALAALAACGALGGPGAAGEAADSVDPTAERRRAMVEDQVRARGVVDPAVLSAMREVPRHRFVPADLAQRAYEDRPLPIGHAQTISQPYIVALMCDLLEVGPGDRVLEIGTGSGYHAAVLSRLVDAVHTIEIVAPLAARARRVLAQLGYANIHVRTGDGYRGWPEAAPFDAILLTAAPPAIPPPLIEQLKVGGRLVAPVGEGVQELTVLTRTSRGYETEKVAPVLFVPMTGEAQGKSKP